MNDATPRRLSGSLLERAAAMYDFAPTPVSIAPDAPAPAFAPAATPVDPVVAETPSPQPEVAPARPVVRRFAPVDRDALAERGMLVPGGPVTPLGEEFRLVKRQLLLTARAVADTQPQKSRLVLVCSARPDDGKTFCAVNLALSMAAEKDVEVVLVDGDLVKPDVLASLGIENDGPGLLDALGDAAIDVESCIVDTDVPQLSVLPAGTRSNSDTELLGSARAAVVLDRLASANPRRIVIFDSPPALAASPASVLAGQVGQVLVVVRADRTGERDLREAVSLLDGCDHVQLVINSVAFQPGGRRFGGYYGREPAE